MLPAASQAAVVGFDIGLCWFRIWWLDFVTKKSNDNNVAAYVWVTNNHSWSYDIIEVITTAQYLCVVAQRNKNNMGDWQICTLCFDYGSKFSLCVEILTISGRRHDNGRRITLWQYMPVMWCVRVLLRRGCSATPAADAHAWKWEFRNIVGTTSGPNQNTVRISATNQNTSIILRVIERI